MTLSLTRGDVETVVKELLEVQDLSRVIGLQLKVPRRIVADIHKRYTNPKDRLYYVLVEFLKQVEPRPTWSAIVDALRSPAVNLQYLAQRIQRKYCLGDDESRSFHMTRHHQSTPMKEVKQTYIPARPSVSHQKSSPHTFPHGDEREPHSGHHRSSLRPLPLLSPPSPQLPHLSLRSRSSPQLPHLSHSSSQLPHLSLRSRSSPQLPHLSHSSSQLPHLSLRSRSSPQLPHLCHSSSQLSQLPLLSWHSPPSPQLPHLSPPSSQLSFFHHLRSRPEYAKYDDLTSLGAVQASVEKIGPGVQHSSRVSLRKGLKLRQPGFCTEKCILYTGKEDSFIWEEGGISLHFPSAVCDNQIQVSIALVTLVDEKYVLPEGGKLISAMYKITASDTLPAPVTVQIHHCVQLVPYDEPFSRKVTFIRANDGPPYNFKPLPGGKFSCESTYGEIEMSDFCCLSILWNFFGWRMSLSVHLFYHSNSSATFVVTKNVPAHNTSVEDEYSNAVAVYKRSMMCNFCTKTIVLVVPSDREDKGWRVAPVFRPAEIDMLDIQEYEPGKTSPNIQLNMTWEGEGEPIEEEIEIKVQGGRLESFVLFCRPTSTMVPVEVTQSQRSGHLELNKDLLDALDVLRGLSKEEIRKLGYRLGLSHATVNNYATSTTDDFLERTIVDWINKKDNVLARGGVTWENLKQALQSGGLHGFARKI